MLEKFANMEECPNEGRLDREKLLCKEYFLAGALYHLKQERQD